MTIQTGDRIPEVTLKRIREGMETIDTHALFGGRRADPSRPPGISDTATLRAKARKDIENGAITDNSAPTARR